MKPVALLCTSGTAAANYLPALVEAKESEVPLLVLTADRPPELRHCAAGQTIDQQKLYGDQVVFYHELGVPEADLDRLRYLRQTVAQACHRSLSPQAGPVHLNCPFREPLYPAPEHRPHRGLKELLAESFWAHLSEPLSVDARLAEWPLPAVERGVVIAGPSGDPSREHASKIALLAQRLGWPVLADALSPLRHHAFDTPALIPHYDLVLRSPGLAERLRPEAVLVLDGLPTSKALRTWLAGLGDVPVLYLSSHVGNLDAVHGCSRQSCASLDSVLTLLGEGPVFLPSPYAKVWAEAESAAREPVARELSACTELFEPKAAWLLFKHLPAKTPVFVANSMPVRDCEYVVEAGDLGCPVYFNRGANGIDGTLSTALGVAHAMGGAAVLLTGDLSLLHDSNGLMLGRKLKGALTIVLINNDGGGIFGHLPVASEAAYFESHFATPQQVSFAALAKAHGVKHTSVRDWEHFTRLIRTLPARGIRILELRTDRKKDAAQRKRLFASAAEAASSFIDRKFG